LEHARGSARCRGRVTIPEWVAAWAREIKRVAAR
jgi:hypothetical protein